MVTRFVNSVMKQGKKSTAERIVYGALEIIEEKTGQDGLAVMRQAMNNVRPNLEVKSRRVGGATYQVPVEIKPERRTALAMRWLISFAKSRPDHTMAEKLASELIAACQERGRGDQEEGGYASHGGGQQGLRALPLVSRALETTGSGAELGRRPGYGRSASSRIVARSQHRSSHVTFGSIRKASRYRTTGVPAAGTPRQPSRRGAARAVANGPAKLGSKALG